MVFTGNATPKLAADVVQHLNISLGKAKVGRFSDGEVMVEVLENVRGKDVFVLQSTCAPTNDHLMEIMLMVDALKRSSAGRITAVVPYFGYSRQDRRPRSARHHRPHRSSCCARCHTSCTDIGSGGGTASVTYSTVAGGSAVAGTDYTTVSGTLSFSNGIIVDASTEAFPTRAHALRNVAAIKRCLANYKILPG